MKKITCDSIIFDMDGVLVTNAAYCQAIKRTVEFVVQKRFKLKRKVETTYINTIKSITGFNNDWDTSYALINLLGRGVTAAEFRQKVELISPQTRVSQEYQEVKDIFQTLYLGKNLSDGLITQETLLIDKSLLGELATIYPLAIATSRPKFEALFAAKNLKLSPLIKTKFIVAKEDAPQEKPQPDPLLEAKRRLATQKPVYIGDTVNDVIAAQKADMPCIFIGNQQLGDIQVINVNQIRELLL